MQKSDKIKIETETGQTLDVVVTSFSAEAIWILIGEGTHSSKCKLEPTRNGLAFAGSVMGREIFYQRSVKDIRGELVRKVRQGGGFRK